MASPEAFYRPRVSAPHAENGDLSNGQPDENGLQQNSLLESTPVAPQSPLENPDAEFSPSAETEPIEENFTEAGEIVAQSHAPNEDGGELCTPGPSKSEPLVVVGDQQTTRDTRDNRRAQIGHIRRLAGGSEVIGKPGFRWREELSEDGKKLFSLLLREMGDVHLLPTFAAQDKFDLDVALHELRKHDLLDESNPRRIRLVNEKI